MRLVLKLFCATALIIPLTIISSCTKTCDEGYGGERCDVPVRDKFLGVWNAVDNPGNLAYTDSIFTVGSSNMLEVYIAKNFANHFLSHIKAKVDGRTITINEQKPAGDTLYVKGIGTLSEDHSTLNWSYDLINKTDSVTTSYTGVWTR